MSCPLCGGDFDEVSFEEVSGQSVKASQCSQCGSFWFNKATTTPLNTQSVLTRDMPQNNYSFQATDLFCPTDQSLLFEESDHTMIPTNIKMWHCNDCGGTFFPKGQLALFTQWENEANPAHVNQARSVRSTSSTIVGLLGLLFISVAGSLNRYNLLFAASTSSPLPNTGPNIITLVFLSIAYISGTVLAVLGRKLPVIIVGWSVIAACMLGFIVVIFGP